mmetsp:Transcript_103159/g.183320  ORF Transcript_103159/g.183320 Transcript_103159/m.183320 type:complete len:155 (-) Transcript_103159:78-542(-)|eukprot:CAMPEP_0197653982 /NCGR_PEP_ID=MMETSP1338-20131121/38098_1 /TAXON_ID=43686 ORGANISM="Pelagodinium beii, Strain RCC1491" /NCGR_SAMPLE_ID=MMETSP1338 /ASSEMBLY_ACC=CAM_ASM_000754 /LENGTH=154 /DNA_ID=CAMNT_0043229323 /DNA_START=56 /DNA_END=520 /DNA_ORIENTATION=-
MGCGQSSEATADVPKQIVQQPKDAGAIAESEVILEEKNIVEQVKSAMSEAEGEKSFNSWEHSTSRDVDLPSRKHDQRKTDELEKFLSQDLLALKGHVKNKRKDTRRKEMVQQLQHTIVNEEITIPAAVIRSNEIDMVRFGQHKGEQSESFSLSQ